MSATRQSWSGLALLAVVFGVLSMLIGVFAGPVSEWINSGAPKRLRVGLIVIGCLLIAIGVLKHRFFGVYKESAVVVVNAVLIFLVLEFVSGVALTVQHLVWPAVDETASEQGGVAVSQPKMLRQDYGAKHARFVSWLGSPQQSANLSVDEQGLRVTPFEAPGASAKPIELFAFGGSTMWGEGVADNETIASYLQQELSRRLTLVSAVGCQHKA